VMPHADFLEFADVGMSLAQGELPATFKRAPLYPLVVGLLGRVVAGEAPVRAAAEWLNALLLPVNGVLVYLLARRWLGAASAWAAAWFLLLPVGFECTAHLLAEPLLTTMILATLLATQHGSKWVYLAAAAATMTRYDAAGLIVGVALAQRWANGSCTVQDSTDQRPVPQRRVPQTMAALAAAPLVIWLVLTAGWWQGRSSDHYVRQMIERPTFEPFGLVRRFAATVYGLGGVRLPIWIESLEAALPVMAWILCAAALIGIVVKLRERDRLAICGVTFLAGYALVHSIFVFAFDRFAYPPAPMLILLAGGGLVAVRRALARLKLSATPGLLLVLLVLAVAMSGIAEEVLNPAALKAGKLAGLLPLVLLPLIVLCLAASIRSYVARAALIGVVVVLAQVRLRAGDELIQRGQELPNLVEAARWVARAVPPDARVLSPLPGLLRLYAQRPRERFPAYQDIEADEWSAIVQECRRRGIAYIVWHDVLAELHGGYYSEKHRLGRFEPLRAAQDLPDVEVVRAFNGRPNVVVVRLRD
jgi:hypothetical protein